MQLGKLCKLSKVSLSLELFQGSVFLRRLVCACNMSTKKKSLNLSKNNLIQEEGLRIMRFSKAYHICVVLLGEPQCILVERLAQASQLQRFDLI